MEKLTTNNYATVDINDLTFPVWHVQEETNFNCATKSKSMKKLADQLINRV